MLAEPNVIMESTDAADTVPLIGFITTDDGHTLLAVAEREDGTLEIMTAPIALMPQNNMMSSTVVKTMDGNFILYPSIFQLNLESMPGTGVQQTNLLPMQQFDNTPVVVEQMKVLPDANDCAVMEPLLPIGDESNILSDEHEQMTIDIYSKDESVPVFMAQNTLKKSLGRPKKTGNTQPLKCDICRQEFTKQTLYRRHVENHAEEKPHRCPKCPASFNIPTNFTLHMATHNTGDPKCPECGRKYARMASLKSHMLLHEKEENLFCTECEDAFSTKPFRNYSLRRKISYEPRHLELTYADRQRKRCSRDSSSPTSEATEMRVVGPSWVNRSLIIARERREKENGSRRRETHEEEQEEREGGAGRDERKREVAQGGLAEEEEEHDGDS
ncbi:Zinc finger protein 236 [Harpegnathos saltator]|uniref:Zinc finger protein 236 n=1 Tax=Harpegnathos saltator TaxID=610380 RepID=E2B3H3_HARSA|nr:Zinc finger protein 236 [Harpegnathos saltator]